MGHAMYSSTSSEDAKNVALLKKNLRAEEGSSAYVHSPGNGLVSTTQQEINLLMLQQCLVKK